MFGRGGGAAFRPSVTSRRLARVAVLLALAGPVTAAAVPAAGPAAERPVPAASGAALLATDDALEPVGRLPAVGDVARPTPPAVAVPEPTPVAPEPSTTSTPAPAPVETAESAPLPMDVDPGDATQVVTVQAARSSSTSAQLTAWQLGPDGWTVALGPVTARIGAGGVGTVREGSTRTPAGVFSLAEAFGRSDDPGTALPYRQVDGDDWWVSDVASPRYNTWAECAPGACDFDESAGENLGDAGPAYDLAVVIGYNTAGTPGAGSAFFLHVSDGSPTAGCVAVPRPTMVSLLQWLDPTAGPVIAIGVG